MFVHPNLPHSKTSIVFTLVIVIITNDLARNMARMRGDPNVRVHQRQSHTFSMFPYNVDVNTDAGRSHNHISYTICRTLLTCGDSSQLTLQAHLKKCRRPHPIYTTSNTAISNTCPINHNVTMGVSRSHVGPFYLMDLHNIVHYVMECLKSPSSFVSVHSILQSVHYKFLTSHAQFHSKLSIKCDRGFSDRSLTSRVFLTYPIVQMFGGQR